MTGWKQRVKDYFSERATAWVAYYADPEPRTISAQHLVSRQRFALQMVEAAIPPSARILDAGCGTGENALFFAQRGYKITGIDYLPGPIELAKKKAAERGISATFLVIDACRAPRACEMLVRDERVTSTYTLVSSCVCVLDRR